LGEKKMMTTDSRDSSGIVFDSKSGISEEEQREILAKIDNIAEKNRLSLSEGEGKNKKNRFKAKKSGGRFPIIVNIIAFTALAGGLAVLISTQGKTDARIRTGAKVYNSAERALIDEIRKETQNEAAASANAGVELDRLNREQSQAAAVEDQIGAFFANLNRQIADNRLDEAAATIRAMREFINTPSFEALRPIQARKGLYTQAIISFETMIEQTRKYQTGPDSVAGDQNNSGALQARITQLEQNLAEKDKTIDALSSQGSGATRRLNELEKANNTLQAENKRLTTDLDRQTRSATKAENDLKTEKAETARLNQAVITRDSTIARHETTIANRNDVITRIRSEVELDRDYDDIPPSEIKTRITRIQSALRSVN
jgi:uncharacterized coiled-coil protein SlyX